LHKRLKHGAMFALWEKRATILEILAKWIFSIQSFKVSKFIIQFYKWNKKDYTIPQIAVASLGR